MDRVLTAATVVRDPRTTAVVTLHAGTVVPAWAEDLIGEHLTAGGTPAAGGEATAPATSPATSPVASPVASRVADPTNPPEPAAPPDPEPDPNPAPELVEPPRAGRGSSLDAWKTYAEARGITVPAEATRDDIVALVTEQ